jgi:3-hydroxyisobutyrate dehydrogenase-like beta-hydroxyacid dehydrogenase
LNAPAVGFIGFGEAAFGIARGLGKQGVTSLVAYDIHTTTHKRGELIRARAEEAHVALVSSYAEVPLRSDIRQVLRALGRGKQQ